jgi:hypothetical protein
VLCGLRIAPIEDRLRGLAGVDLVVFWVMDLAMLEIGCLVPCGFYRNYQCLYNSIFPEPRGQGACRPRLCPEPCQTTTFGGRREVESTSAICWRATDCSLLRCEAALKPVSFFVSGRYIPRFFRAGAVG